jgi:deazaflavin-dependent oxidoreductase (nitroreductase family)
MSGGALDRHQVCHVTTVGRRTGRPHRIEIWFAHHHPSIYLLSGGGDRSDWVANIRTHADVTVEFGRERWSGSGRILLPGTSEDRLARDLVYAKYQAGYPGDLREWRDSALPVAIDLALA